MRNPYARSNQTYGGGSGKRFHNSASAYGNENNEIVQPSRSLHAVKDDNEVDDDDLDDNMESNNIVIEEEAMFNATNPLSMKSNARRLREQSGAVFLICRPRKRINKSLVLFVSMMVGFSLGLVFILVSVVAMKQAGSNDSPNKVVAVEQDDDLYSFDIPLASNGLKQRCSHNSVLSEDGFEECEEECAIALCCIMDKDLPDFCFVGATQDVCITYEPCTSIFPLFGQLEVEVTTYVVGKTKKSEPKKEIEGPSDDKTNSYVGVGEIVSSACSDDNVKTSEGYELCKGICEMADCCFRLDPNVKNCLDSAPTLCLEYARCMILLEYHP